MYCSWSEEVCNVPVLCAGGLYSSGSAHALFLPGRVLPHAGGGDRAAYLHHLRLPPQAQERDDHAHCRRMVYVPACSVNNYLILFFFLTLLFMFDTLHCLAVILPVVPAVIVAICLAITRTEGYGGSKT
jgi:hypothetical protein